MRKICVIILCGALLTLAGCGKNEQSAVKPAVSSTSKADAYKEPIKKDTGGTTVIVDDPAASRADAANTARGTTGSKSQNASSSADDYVIEDDLGGTVIRKYLGDGGKVTVPSKLDGKEVIGISDNAFRGSKIMRAAVPSSVKTIGLHAFSGCDSLESAEIYDGVEEIGGYAFADCPKLCIVTLPDSIKEIGSGAFNSCPNLKLTYKGQTYTAANVEELYDVF